MDIIVARPEHVEAMTAITNRAKANMAAMGIDQWQAGYPDRATWEADVAEGMAYVGLESGRVVAAFRYSNTPEAAYGTLKGEWLTAGPYATIHRCAVDPDERGRGLIAELFQFACDKAAAEGMTSMRIDTHTDNAPMGRAVEKFGFTYCGAITLTEGPEAGGARIAFEKVL
ncbi:MAG: GNAT family N-acetyltransferase [Adlercreutzia sp.]|nr:GNAT family N-acetyltransferase [Adlercreutzia sp.]